MFDIKVTFIFIFYMLSCVLGQGMLNLNRGDICNGTGSTASRCEYLRSCQHIGDFRANRPPICSFDGIHPIICCPPGPSQPLTTSPGLVSNGNAERKCFQYSKENCITISFKQRLPFSRSGSSPSPDDGNDGSKKNGSESKVFGGRSARARDHRHMVLVGYGAADSKSWDCGGSLIAERWVLSAAHCSTSKSQGPANWARVGDLDLSSTTEDARPQEKRIIERIIHPNYKEPAVYNDIVLFKLDSSVLFNDWVAPVCLHTTFDIPSAKGTVTGWGRLDFVGDVSAKLQEVDISLVNGSECKRKYDETRDTKIPQGINVETMVCAGEKEGGKDACSGDSGGPLVITLSNSCLKTQIGVTSFGRDCGLPDTPGIYTRISQFVPWIESVVWPIA